MGIIIINFCAVLLLIIIPNGVQANELVANLRRITINGETIDGLFKPLEELGSGYSGVTYRGQFLPHDNIEIAMKFAWTIEVGKQEYKMYTYLNAINNPNVLADGISSICYFGTWNNHTMIGMTLHDTTFMKDINDGKIDELHLLIVFREFVRIIKYCHSKGIIHDDNFINMAVQSGHGFIFDFGISRDMVEYTREQSIQLAKHDFIDFLNKIFSKMRYYLPNSTWNWIGLSPVDKQQLQPNNWPVLITELAKQAGNDNHFSGLRRVFVEFAKHAADKHSTEVKDTKGNLIPFYDQLYQVICEECKNYGCEATTFVSISSIPDPFKVEKYDRPEVNYKLFEVMYADRIRCARETPPN